MRGTQKMTSDGRVPGRQNPTLDLFVLSKRPKALNNVSAVPTNTPSQLRPAQKVIDKVKMPQTESLLAIGCVQRPSCPEWK